MKAFERKKAFGWRSDTLNRTLRTREETADIYRRNIDAVYRVCMLFFKGSRADAEDAAQSTFLKLMKSPVKFENVAHEKSWLIVVASNICRDSLRSGWKTRVQLDDESLAGIPAEDDRSDLLRQVMELPDKCKTAVYMYYYEGYTSGEIAAAMGKSKASVWGYLHSGRKLLREALKEEEYEG